MDNPNLERLLKRARSPEIPEESLELFPCQIISRLKRNPPRPRPAKDNPLRFAWAVGLSASLVIALLISHPDNSMKSGSLAAPDTLADAKLIQETLALFPNQVRAIVENDHGLNLILSQKEDVPASTPVYVHICDGKQCSSFVTFSGQDIPVAGQTVTVLVDVHGGIILMGNTFVWSDTNRSYAGARLKIEAKKLSLATM